MSYLPDWIDFKTTQPTAYMTLRNYMIWSESKGARIATYFDDLNVFGHPELFRPYKDVTHWCELPYAPIDQKYVETQDDMDLGPSYKGEKQLEIPKDRKKPMPMNHKTLAVEIDRKFKRIEDIMQQFEYHKQRQLDENRMVFKHLNELDKTADAHYKAIAKIADACELKLDDNA